MDIIAMQAAFILGGTGFVGKFINSPEERKFWLPFAAFVLGVASQCYVGGFSIENVIQGAIIGGTTTGLYGAMFGTPAVVIEEEASVPVRGVES